ncbi:MAG: twin-arginine translocase TatA/TatE family subunit [Methylobacteriaceae bacterium]|nr:twin-arginine translocase TatA/TatE family subunit [Methylobacteriaceae bacterium]
MGSMSIWHWIIVGGVALVLFGGKGKISDLMGDFAKGIKSFKKGMAEDDSTDVSHPVDPPRNIPHQAGSPVEKTADTRKV